jgi:GT2 family glycosyltransferase
MPDLSICILTRHQPELLPKCVASCVAEVERSGISSEIIIIDNASWDGSPQRVASLYQIVSVIRNEENLGFSAANNKAIRVSRGRLVLILNDDAMLERGSLNRMLKGIDADSRIAAVGPMLLNPDGSLQRYFTNRRFPRLRSLFCGFLGLDSVLDRWAWTRDLLTHSRDPEVSGETDYIAGACLLARREALDSVGLFDEKFYYLFEDTDLCHRLKDAGRRVVYLADAHVTHYGSASLNKLTQLEKSAIHSRSLVYYLDKHLSRFKSRALRLALALLFLIRLPFFCVYRALRYGTTRQEWRESVGRSLQAVRSLVLDRPLDKLPRYDRAGAESGVGTGLGG